MGGHHCFHFGGFGPNALNLDSVTLLHFANDAMSGRGEPTGIERQHGSERRDAKDLVENGNAFALKAGYNCDAACKFG